MSFNNIPNNWFAEQDLAIYEFLGEIQQQIWERYELQLIDLLCADIDVIDTDQIYLFELK